MSKIIGEIQKNALQKIIVSIQDYKGKRFIDVRVYYDNNGDWCPTKKGISLSIEYYKEVVELILKAGKKLKEKFVKVKK